LSSAPVPRGRPADTAKRAAIIDAAVAAFFDRGYAAASIEQIAANAGVSKVTVYSHFGDKRGLFAAAVETECERMREHFSIEGIEKGSVRDRLLAIGEAMVAFLSRPEMVQFDRRIAAETAQEPEIGKAFLAAGPYRMKQAFAAFLRAMGQSGHLRIDDPDLAAEQFVSMCKGMGDLERRFGNPPDARMDRERIRGAVEVFCRAYAQDASRPAGGGR
jgi:TetR/AcrR family transcriptional repressor of mexJK operon